MPYVNPEPPPKHSASEPVWPIVTEQALRLFSEPHETQVAFLLTADMHERDAFGRKKHGTPLQVDNGRDHLTDAYQEALDLCVYLKAEELRERAKSGTADTQDVTLALGLAYRLRLRLLIRDGR